MTRHYSKDRLDLVADFDFWADRRDPLVVRHFYSTKPAAVSRDVRWHVGDTMVPVLQTSLQLQHLLWFIFESWFPVRSAI